MEVKVEVWRETKEAFEAEVRVRDENEVDSVEKEVKCVRAVIDLAVDAVNAVLDMMADGYKVITELDATFNRVIEYRGHVIYNKDEYKALEEDVRLEDAEDVAKSIERTMKKILKKVEGIQELVNKDTAEITFEI